MNLVKSAPLSTASVLASQLNAVADKCEAMRFTATPGADIDTLNEAVDKARELAIQVNGIWDSLPLGPTVYDISAAGYLYGVLHLDTFTVQDARDFIREADVYLAYVTPFELALIRMNKAA